MLHGARGGQRTTCRCCFCPGTMWVLTSRFDSRCLHQLGHLSCTLMLPVHWFPCPSCLISHSRHVPTNISSLSAHVHTEVVLGGLAISPFLFLLPTSSSFALPCGQSHLPLAPTSLLPFISSTQVDTSEVTQTQNVLHTTFQPP